jgi:hypothetical protein
VVLDKIVQKELEVEELVVIEIQLSRIIRWWRKCETVLPGTVYTITVGAGGAGGINQSSGTWFYLQLQVQE